MDSSCGDHTLVQGCRSDHYVGIWTRKLLQQRHPNVLFGATPVMSLPYPFTLARAPMLSAVIHVNALVLGSPLPTSQLAVTLSQAICPICKRMWTAPRQYLVHSRYDVQLHARHAFCPWKDGGPKVFPENGRCCRPCHYPRTVTDDSLGPHYKRQMQSRGKMHEKSS